MFKSKNTIIAEQIMIDFIEGKLSFEDFKKEYLSNKQIYKLLYKRALKGGLWAYSSEQIKNADDSNFYLKADIAKNVNLYLDLKKIKHDINNQDLINYIAFYKYVPSWLGFDNQNVLKKLIESIVKDDSIKNKKTEISKLIDETFPCEKYRPKWIQSPEWPIIDGIPCKFLYQTGFPNNHDYIEYFFLNQQNGKTIIIEQFD